MIQESEDGLTEERREVGCQWESPEEERREVGCQWESPEEERREVGCQWESPEEERREVGCQWESPEEERREVGCQWESPEEERREVGCQWESPEEERREVGCQWESPEEERREVGCQSDSAERRDAAVQVDLLSQQLSWRHTGVCGVAWRCVSVRADEPGGGALLHHCRTHHSPPLGHTQLPTMPLFQSPAPPEFKELQQTTSLPSMPLGEQLLPLPPADVSAPPSGLIAPLSPHLAEELKVEGEGGVMDTEQVRRPRRKRVGPPIRYLLESEEQSHGLSVANHSRGMTVKEEEVEEEEVEEEEEEVDGVKPVKTEDTEQAGRPRRKTVGPPIRYLLESEEQSHGLSATNHSIARGAKAKMKAGRPRTEHQEEEERRGEVELCQVCGLNFTCESSLQLHLSVHRAGSQLSFTNTSPLHHHHQSKQEVNTNSDGERMERRDEEEVKTLLPVSTKASDWLICRKRVRRNPRWWVDFCTTMRRRQERDGLRGRKRRRCREEEEKGGGGGEEKVEEEQPQRPRRTRVGPPIRYLLESEELSHWPITTNQERAGGWRDGRKPQKKINNEGGASDNVAMIDSPKLTEHSDRTNQDRGNRLKESGGRPNKVGIECNAGGGASERHKTLLPASTKASDWLRCRKRVRRDPRWLVDFCVTVRRRRQERDGARGRKRRRCREDEEQEKGGGGGGEEKLEEEQPQRPRRTRVGPPIRYLLESEELSHWPITTNQGRAGGWREGRKPQKKINAGGGATERHKTLLPASTKASDWLRRRNPRWWVDYRATMRRRRQDRDGARGRKRRRCREEEEDTAPSSFEVKDVCLKEEGEGGEEKGGEDGEEVRQTEVKKEEEQPQKPRRMMVGPPIRYLLESEELSHGLATAYQDRAADFKEGRKPQKKSKVGGGASEDTAMIDRPEDTDWQAERQMGLTNQDRLDGPNERGGSPNKVMIHREARGGASEMTDRATPVSDRQTGSYIRSYLVYIDLQSSQVTVLSPCCVRLQRLPLIG